MVSGDGFRVEAELVRGVIRSTVERYYPSRANYERMSLYATLKWYIGGLIASSLWSWGCSRL